MIHHIYIFIELFSLQSLLFLTQAAVVVVVVVVGYIGFGRLSLRVSRTKTSYSGSSILPSSQGSESWRMIGCASSFKNTLMVGLCIAFRDRVWVIWRDWHWDIWGDWYRVRGSGFNSGIGDNFVRCNISIGITVLYFYSDVTIKKSQVTTFYSFN